MKLKEGIVVEKINDEYVAVATGEAAMAFNGLIRGNKTMNFILSKLSEDISEDALVAAMLEKYDVSEEIARRDVKTLVNKLFSAGLLNV